MINIQVVSLVLESKEFLIYGQLVFQHHLVESVESCNYLSFLAYLVYLTNILNTLSSDS